MKRLMFFIVALASFSLSASAWSQKGHDVTAYIAECHLGENASQAVDSIFGGKSMVYWCNWLDNASHTPEYAYTSTWHYKNINEGVTFEGMSLHPNGDVVVAAMEQIEKLKCDSLSPEEAALSLKILIHLLGDMHQPMHLGRQTDLGGNKVKVKYFGRDSNLHSVWDGSLVNSAHNWSYSEWQNQIDRVSPEEEYFITQGTLADWAKQTYMIACDVYGGTKEGENLSYDYVSEWTPIIEQQLLFGGLRLAYVLNSIWPD